MNDQQMNQGPSNKMWYIVGIIIIIALAFWYFSAKPAPTAGTQSTAVEQTQPSSNTTAAISTELNQTSDGSAALEQAAAASAQAVQGF